MNPYEQPIQPWLVSESDVLENSDIEFPSTCSQCSELIGNKQSPFVPFWVFDEDCERATCAGCVYRDELATERQLMEDEQRYEEYLRENDPDEYAYQYLNQ
jgi:hypothetical protein